MIKPVTMYSVVGNNLWQMISLLGRIYVQPEATLLNQDGKR